jgi:precorrin-2/cobalt-factor-2 C20-methyltransferase
VPYVVPYVARSVSDVHKSSLYLPDRLKAALAGRAAATGQSEAALIREAIEAALSTSPAAAPAPREPAVPGHFVGVGVGPGEADLVTIRAVTALRRADRVLAPSTAVDAVGRAEAIVRQALPGLPIERVPFSMAPSRSARDRSVQRAAAAVTAHLQNGEEVAWITLGDPLVYSTFSSVAAAVVKRRPASTVSVVPGIMAFQALAARSGTAVTDERQRLVVRTALDGEDISAELADPAVTVVLYKGGRRLPDLAKAAAAAGRLDGAVAGELLGMPGERIGALSDLAADGPASYLATVIIPASSPAASQSGRESCRCSGTIPAENGAP